MESVPKKLVIDANILFSFFQHKSFRRYLIEELLNSDCELISPEFVFEELLNSKPKILKFSGIDNSDFDFLYSLLLSEIISVKSSKYFSSLSESDKISPHSSKKDSPYFALALFSNCPIWSDEKAFLKQDKIRIFSTKDLLKLLTSLIC